MRGRMFDDDACRTMFKRIRLNLARSKEFPTGSARHGYEFVAPLDAQRPYRCRRMAQASQTNCRVRRFWGDEEEIGQLVHKPGGKEHARWVFDYDQTAEDDDEAGYRFGTHAFRPGEYVSIRDEYRRDAHVSRWRRSKTLREALGIFADLILVNAPVAQRSYTYNVADFTRIVTACLPYPQTDWTSKRRSS